MATLPVQPVDRRTTTAKRWRNALIKDLGGRQSISIQQATIIELAVGTKFILDSIDAWLLTQPSFVDERRRALFPAVRERQQVADALARYLGQLGLERSSAMFWPGTVNRSVPSMPLIDTDEDLGLTLLCQ